MASEFPSGPIPTEIPPPDYLRKLREWLGLSQTELAEELGFAKHGHDVIRGWEMGQRNGQECRPTGLAWKAFRGLAIISLALRCYDKTGFDDAAHAALAMLRENAPERLR